MVLSALRGRTVALVGDSTMQQLWTGLVAELYRAPLALDMVQRVLEFNMVRESHNRDGMCTVSHTVRPPQGGSEVHFRLDKTSERTCNLTRHRGGPSWSRWPLHATCRALPDLEMYVPKADVRFLFYRMDANATKPVRPAFVKSQHCGARHLLFDERLEAAMKTSDVVMANIGVWYFAKGSKVPLDNPDRASSHYRSDIQHVLARLSTLAPQGKLGLFRESTPQHFPTDDGSGLFEQRDPKIDSAFKGRRLAGCASGCAPLGPAFTSRPDWRNEMVSGLADDVRFPVDAIVPVSALLRPMQALHKNVKWKCALDCTHYCYHPDLWAALLDGVFRRWYKWALTTSLPIAPRGSRAALRTMPAAADDAQAHSSTVRNKHGRHTAWVRSKSSGRGRPQGRHM